MNKIILAIILSVTPLARAGFITTNIDFNSFTVFTEVGTSYSQGGVTIDSGAPMIPVTGSFSALLFGGGGYLPGSPALYAPSNDFLAITAGGELMAEVHFTLGFDWNFSQIEYGLLDTFFNWQAWKGSQLVSSGSLPGGKSHGGILEEIASASGFDRLLLSSTAIQYQALPGNTRGQELPAQGYVNAIAIDNLSVTFDPPDPVATPDGANTFALMASAGGLIAAARRFFK